MYGLNLLPGPIGSGPALKRLREQVLPFFCVAAVQICEDS